MLIDELKKANIQAMKDRDNVKRGVLSIVLTKYKLEEVEAKAKGKDYGDSDLLAIIQKTLKELNDEKEGYLKANNATKAKEISLQEETIKAYLPQQLSEDEIKAEIAKLDDKSIPNVMKYFKANFAGKVDMSKVSAIARTL